jgi:CRISPR-associated protein Csb2
LLAIEVDYLLGRSFASGFRDPTETEWPPHPARLFSALVAAHHDTNGTEVEREALRWLESQPPPQISASLAGMPLKVVTFVPTNYSGKSGSSHPDQRGKQPRSFPAQAPGSPLVFFIWPNAALPDGYGTALGALAERVVSLGRACSFVRARVVEKFEGNPNWVPDEAGRTVISVPGEGRLDELEQRYRFGLRPEQASQVRYREVRGDDEHVAELRGHFGEMIILRRVSGVGFPMTSTRLLTGRLRAAFLSKAGDGAKLSAMLSGHDDHGPSTTPHVAFAALPYVGGDFGDGRLMGLAVILPVSITRAEKREALRACASIESLALGELGEWRVEIANFDVTQYTLKPETWMRPSRRWATVTPIILDRFPKKKLPVEELLVTACVRAGFPAPARATFSPYSDTAAGSGLKGVAPVFGYDLERWATHATFEFNVQVKGPLLVGAGRFFGMGLMKPLFGRAVEQAG